MCMLCMCVHHLYVGLSVSVSVLEREREIVEEMAIEILETVDFSAAGYFSPNGNGL